MACVNGVFSPLCSNSPKSKSASFKVSNTYSHEDEFYLHFQMKNMKHALELFEEMLEIIGTLVNKPKTKVLLCCCGGLTTGFFAMKLNESVKILQKDYLFEAVAFDQLSTVAKDYDVDINMVYTIAAYHDLGHHIDRKKTIFDMSKSKSTNSNII